MSDWCAVAMSMAVLVTLASASVGQDDVKVRVLRTPEEKARRERERKAKLRPILVCRPASLRAKVKRGDEAELGLTISNGGDRSLYWYLTKLPAWLATDTVHGELAARQERRVVLHVRAQLVPGTSASADVLLQAPGANGSPKTVTVSVEVEPSAGEREPPSPGEGALPVPEPISASVAPSRRRMGARVGCLVTVGESEAEYDGSIAVGLYYSGHVLGRLPFEAGFDLAWIDSDDGADESNLYLLRFDLLFSKPQEYEGHRFYLLAGMGAALASPEEQENESVLSLNFGAGLMPTGNRWDIRATYSVMVDSDNIGGLLLLTAGYRF